MKKTSASRKVFMAFTYMFLLLTCLTCVLPFLNLLAVSFSSNAAVAAGKVSFWPKEFTTFSYEYALRGGKFLKALLVSVELVVLGTLVNLILMVLTAYPLSKSREKLLGRNIIETC